MPPRTDAVEGKDFIITDHPEDPSLQCKAWLNEDGSIRDYRSIGNDGRRPGHLIKAPQVLLDNRVNSETAGSLAEIRWKKNQNAINEAINEWAYDLLKDTYYQDEILEEATEIADRIIAGDHLTLQPGKLGSLSEADSTKLIVRLMLERYSDKEDKPPLRDMVQTVKEVLKLAKRTPDTEGRTPTVAVQVNITEGLFSKGFGHE